MNEELGQVYTILTDKTGTLRVRMMCSIMYERLSNSQSTYGEATQKHINDYADAGLRTLVLAYRQLEEIEYTKFERNFTAAKNSVSADRDELIDEATDLIERDLILFGAAAVEDKLQKGRYLANFMNLKSDALFHRYACSLLRQGMKQITITLDTPDIIALEKGGDKGAINKVDKVLQIIVTESSV
ncbi:hypothetical protein VPH35_082761 [Triticum aestivum]|uniref:Phospholipid-transporting ATPase n=1 Tax=Triticum turgidum subsp. durum TaxID=4567 RepID=A0A9R0WLX6_TRITD|nr:unnamed protein product [Triticum turgidum subsp. durum]